jgi:hypothetical protein
MAAAIGCYVAAFFDHDLDPGETGFVLILAASKDQARRVFDYALAFLRGSPILRKMIENITANEIRLNNGITLATHPNSFRSIRGRSLICCIFDEVSVWRDEESALPDLECYRAVRPSLVRCNGMLIGISTPYRKSGLLFTKYQRHFDSDDDAVLVVKGSSALFNPTLDEAKIQKELTDDPEGAHAEWLAEFRTDRSALLDEQVIEDAVDYGRPLELPPRHGSWKYHAFADASAGRNDAFTLCIGHTEGKKGEETFICDVIRDRPAPFDPRSVAHEYAQLARDYGCTKIVGDNYAGEWTASAFADAGARYEVSPLPKSALYLESLPLFNRGAVALPEHKRLIYELRNLERRVHRSGKDSVDHPKHGSDDCANAVCGALYIAVHELHKPRSRTGTYGYGGPVTWKGETPEPLRLKFVEIDGKTGEVLKQETRVYERDRKWVTR